ncbi:hypothetical protein NKOR_05640 [Candidatus Nitrosopumilus koreensis AR1]|uniref:Uncharacterized protein n=1 Tax=Candidatus Nitrosopumilus koreensis AR1 TaxID=1229908 RepID=K0B789_9ARCH|nr:hypothetical protein [Candidatus Nitrosopumilus koreensis]AFS81012.1 hypothetical protein NKOR_05640 [Candidatus Nitrosopumilus koreensis AR1]
MFNEFVHGINKQKPKLTVLKITVILVISILMIGSFNVQSIFAHQPDFSVKTPEDILKFCEFFHQEYKTLGLDSLIDQHSQYPNIRVCAILYNHIAWDSTHKARDIVLIAEIGKYLGDSSFLKERHIKEFTTMPPWIIADIVRWTDGKYKDSLYAYGVRALIENNVISPKITDNVSQRLCIDGSCIKETDYVTYSHTSKYGNTITEKFEVKKIDQNGITVNSKIVSEDGIKNYEFLLDENSKIPNEQKCCKTEKFLYKIPIETGQVIDEKYTVYGTVNLTIGNILREGAVAENKDKTEMVVIDKKQAYYYQKNLKKQKLQQTGKRHQYYRQMYLKSQTGYNIMI